MRVCLWDGLWLTLAYGMRNQSGAVAWHPHNERSIYILLQARLLFVCILLLRFSLTRRNVLYKTQPQRKGVRPRPPDPSQTHLDPSLGPSSDPLSTPDPIGPPRPVPEPSGGLRTSGPSGPSGRTLRTLRPDPPDPPTLPGPSDPTVTQNAGKLGCHSSLLREVTAAALAREESRQPQDAKQQRYEDAGDDAGDDADALATAAVSVRG